MKRVFACLFSFLLCISPFLSGCADEAEIVSETKEIRITFTGDCTLGCDKKLVDSPLSFWHYIEENGFEYPFINLRKIFESDDLTVINLEGVFSDTDTGIADKTYCFRAPKEYTQILTMNSIEAASFANNHTMDFGDFGIKETISALQESKVSWFGLNLPVNEYSTPQSSISKTYIYEKDGVKIGFVAALISNWWLNKSIHKAQVEELREAGCQLIIACLHGGVEYDPRHDSNQENFADTFLKYGCDIVIGNHPHVLQGIRVNDNGTVLYSLGNCCFGGNQVIKETSKGSAKYGAVVQFAFSFDENNNYLGHQMTIWPILSAVQTEKGYSNYQPVLAEGRDAEYVLKLIQRDTKGITLQPYEEGLGAVQKFVPAP